MKTNAGLGRFTVGPPKWKSHLDSMNVCVRRTHKLNLGFCACRHSAASVRLIKAPYDVCNETRWISAINNTVCRYPPFPVKSQMGTCRRLDLDVDSEISIHRSVMVRWNEDIQSREQGNTHKYALKSYFTCSQWHFEVYLSSLQSFSLFSLFLCVCTDDKETGQLLRPVKSNKAPEVVFLQHTSSLLASSFLKGPRKCESTFCTFDQQHCPLSCCDSGPSVEEQGLEW